METLRLLKKIVKEKNAAVLFSSHDWNLILEMVGRIWIIDDRGKLIDGMPEDLILNGQLVKSFDDKKFYFNDLSGTFKELKDLSKFIYMEENWERESLHDKVRYWTVHALTKEGFKIVNSKSENYPEVVIKDNFWQVIFKGATVDCSSIEHVIIIVVILFC